MIPARVDKSAVRSGIGDSLTIDVMHLSGRRFPKPGRPAGDRYGRPEGPGLPMELKDSASPGRS